jgi:hypothetical protein
MIVPNPRARCRDGRNPFEHADRSAPDARCACRRVDAAGGKRSRAAPATRDRRTINNDRHAAHLFECFGGGSSPESLDHGYAVSAPRGRHPQRLDPAVFHWSRQGRLLARPRGWRARCTCPNIPKPNRDQVIELVEVKSSSDKLSAKQKRWITGNSTFFTSRFGAQAPSGVTSTVSIELQ